MGEREEYARRVLNLFYEARWSEMWEHLHPADKRIASQSKFVACETAAGAPAPVISMNYNGTNGEPVDREGLPSSVTVVNFLVRSGTASGEAGVVNDTMRVVDDEGRWWFVLTEGAYRAYRQGECP